MLVNIEYINMKKKSVKRKHLIVVITADIKHKKLLNVDVHIEGRWKSESRIAEKHLKKLKKKDMGVKKFYADGAFDTNKFFDCLEESKVESAVKIRKNATTDHCRGSKRRRQEIRRYHKLGYDQWSAEKWYGMRWVATEGIFPAVKRKFGENIVSKKK